VLFFFHYLLLKKYKNYFPGNGEKIPKNSKKSNDQKNRTSNILQSPLHLALILSGILLFSYPFLSHDFFNYLFDAKIVTFYHQNPYLKRALDFPNDPWIRFMHWTHRTYPYGPAFLLLTLAPSLLSFGKFLLDFFLFKLLFIGFYLISVYLLQKKNKYWAVLFATHPLVLVEGLMNTHNDLIGIALVFIALYAFFEKKHAFGYFFMLISIGIKYVTLPYVFISTTDKRRQLLSAALVLGLMLVWVSRMEIQSWYFLLLFGLIPFFPEYVKKSWLFFAGLLFSYYPYIRFGGWDKQYEVDMKHWIIIVFLALNLLYFVIIFSKRKFFTK
jgi:hypothetical protein